jgi:hypothetical protein
LASAGRISILPLISIPPLADSRSSSNILSFEHATFLLRHPLDIVNASISNDFKLVTALIVPLSESRVTVLLRQYQGVLPTLRTSTFPPIAVERLVNLRVERSIHSLPPE